MPSELHRDLAGRCLRWFAARSTGSGIHGGREVYIEKRYIADVVAIGSFQHRFHLAYCKHVNREQATILDPGGVYPEFTCIFEVKISRADFAKTFRAENGNRKHPRGHMHWIVTPKGMLSLEDLPGFWGLLEAFRSGLREIIKPRYCDQSQASIYKTAYHILMKP